MDTETSLMKDWTVFYYSEPREKRPDTISSHDLKYG